MKVRRLFISAGVCIAAIASMVTSATALTITSPTAGTRVTYNNTQNVRFYASSFGTITCTSSAASGTVTNTTGVTTITNAIATLTYSNCSSSWSPLNGATVVVMTGTGGACPGMTITATASFAGDINLGSGCEVYINVPSGSCHQIVTTSQYSYSWDNSTQIQSFGVSGMTYDSSGGLCGSFGSHTDGNFVATYAPNVTVEVTA